MVTFNHAGARQALASASLIFINPPTNTEFLPTERGESKHGAEPRAEEAVAGKIPGVCVALRLPTGPVQELCCHSTVQELWNRGFSEAMCAPHTRTAPLITCLLITSNSSLYGLAMRMKVHTAVNFMSYDFYHHNKRVPRECPPACVQGGRGKGREPVSASAREEQ